MSKTELAYMKVIWDNPDGISSDDIYRQFSKAAGIKSTILFRISDKGYVNLIRKGVHFLYTRKLQSCSTNKRLCRQD